MVRIVSTRSIYFRARKLNTASKTTPIQLIRIALRELVSTTTKTLSAVSKKYFFLPRTYAI